MKAAGKEFHVKQYLAAWLSVALLAGCSDVLQQETQSQAPSPTVPC
jgi:hypothetical protein